MKPSSPDDSTAGSPIGNFLRARRAQLRPQDFGLPPGQRRRTPGLRREEVAQLCGISPTWLTWIEQGRTRSVSVPTLIAIARGLRLSRAEREYLFGLAAKADPSPPIDGAADRRPLQQLVDAIQAPAYILDQYWDALVWNHAATRQVVRWSERAARLVTEFRAEHRQTARRPGAQGAGAGFERGEPRFRIGLAVAGRAIA